MLEVEPFEVYSIVTGRFRLDGGAMFGVVPKVLWEKATDVDASNRISLTTRSLLAVHRREERVILVDTGCGTKWMPSAAGRFAIEHDAEAISRALSSIGLSVASVTDIVVTHLHFDHNGGLTEWVDKPGGVTRLCFPRARHWIHRRQWEHARNPNDKDRASFLPEDYAGLAESGVLQMIDDDDPPPPFVGLTWRLSQGHTPYQLHPEFGSGQSRILCTGDAIPTVAHLRHTWVMAYDLHPLITMKEKKVFTCRGIEEGLMLAFPHDPAIAGAAIDGLTERPIVARKLSL